QPLLQRAILGALTQPRLFLRFWAPARFVLPTALKPDSTLDSVCFPRTTLEPYGALTGSNLIMSAEQTKAAAAAAPESHGEAPPERPAPFPIAGIGASAGGLEAYTQLLRHVPPDPGIAFVLIQHLD